MTDKCKSAQGLTISSRNREVASRIEASGLRPELEFNLENKSYDIYLSDQSILIEINPTYTHNTIGNHWGPGIDKYYHRDKSKLAEDNGYRCIHVWDWDDINKIIFLLKDKEAIYARKCSLCEIDAASANSFLSEHHLQGKVNGQKVSLGLYYKDELVQVMTFGRPRYNNRYEWELLRLCSDHRYSVVGGAERLWKHFLKAYNPQSEISYCDRAKFTGSVYARLGMVLDHINEPNKVWSKGSQIITNNLLLQRGYDQLFNTTYGKGTSNEQLMLDSGWLPVYDCGQAVYIYQQSEKA